MTLYDLSGIAAAIVFIGAIFLLCMILDEKRDFGLDREKVRVLDFHFAVDKKESETNIVVFGVVTNESEYSWVVGDYEIRYLDSRGNLAGMDKASGAITVLPHGENSFRCDLLSSRKSVPEYPTIKVTVVSADDPKVPFRLLGY